MTTTAGADLEKRPDAYSALDTKLGSAQKARFEIEDRATYGDSGPFPAIKLERLGVRGIGIDLLWPTDEGDTSIFVKASDGEVKLQKVGGERGLDFILEALKTARQVA